MYAYSTVNSIFVEIQSYSTNIKMPLVKRKVEQPVLTRTANGAIKSLILHVRLGCGSLSITTPVSILANEVNVRSVLPGHVSLAAVNQIYIFMRLRTDAKTKIFIKASFENVNIC